MNTWVNFGIGILTGIPLGVLMALVVVRAIES